MEKSVIKRHEIEQELKKHDSTLLSFPSRGEWGDRKYRGNCSGWIQAFLIWKYHVQKMAELFAGSGTGSDVARDMGIDYIGADLNPNPVRGNILTCNAVTDEVPEEFLGADMFFMHPPYGAEIKIPYAGHMWKDTTREHNLSKSDLGQMKWDVFMKELNKIIMKYYASMEAGARMSVLMGDVRRDGRCYSMLKDIVQPGQLEQIIIKAQHNCVSDGRAYSNRNFVPIVHEYIMVIKKLAPYIIDFSLPVKKELDIRDSKSATWRDVVSAVMDKLGEADLDEIYAEIEECEKAKANEHWKAKVRQTLQYSPRFENKKRGVWALAA
nr:hypothetical protein [uncultured Butyrivibrio sp.]